jgi:hypothetical protein
MAGVVCFNQVSTRKATGFANSSGFVAIRLLPLRFLLCAVVLMAGCGAMNVGKVKWIEKTAKDEKYYLVNEISLNAGSSYFPKQVFDHNLNPVVNLVFSLRNEKNHYVAETIWYDPAGLEFRAIRTTHDIQAEGKTDVDRRPISGGTPRVHTISTRELYNHKPGPWKVELYIDGELARRLEFTVR